MAEKRIYAGDAWQSMYAIKNGHLSWVKPTGNIVEDFADFLFKQGGGRSNDPDDAVAKQKGAFPKTAYKDGKRYHTVNDITFPLYKHYFPNATDMDFYEMNEEERLYIINKIIAKGKCTTSDVVNIAIAYTIWGSGDNAPKHVITRFVGYWNMSLNDFIAKYGEDATLYHYLEARRQTMKQRNPTDWIKFGYSWSNGLAQFYRVFKTYTKN